MGVTCEAFVLFWIALAHRFFEQISIEPMA